MNSIASVQISSQSNAATLNDVKQLAASLADKLSEVSGANRQQYQQITQAIMNSTAQLLRLQRDIARAPAIQPDSYIHILDALDRRHKLPYDIFQNFEVRHTRATDEDTGTHLSSWCRRTSPPNSTKCQGACRSKLAFTNSFAKDEPRESLLLTTGPI